MLVAMLRRLQPVAQLASRVVSQQANLTQARRQHARVSSCGVHTHICLRSYAAAFALRLGACVSAKRTVGLAFPSSAQRGAALTRSVSPCCEHSR